MTGSRIALRLVVVLLTLPAAVPALAQTSVDATQPVQPATIKGRIFDAESGESMPYTNVFISGTNLGTMAFTDGFYILRGLRPGTYTVKASYVSYGVGSETVDIVLHDFFDAGTDIAQQSMTVTGSNVAAFSFKVGTGVSSTADEISVSVNGIGTSALSVTGGDITSKSNADTARGPASIWPTIFSAGATDSQMDTPSAMKSVQRP